MPPAGLLFADVRFALGAGHRRTNNVCRAIKDDICHLDTTLSDRKIQLPLEESGFPRDDASPRNPRIVQVNFKR
jgi:hypothetical protein